MGLHRAEILEGMTIALWKDAVDVRSREGRGPRKIRTSVVAAEQRAVIPAAEDLVKLYEANIAAAVGAPTKIEFYYEAQRLGGIKNAYQFGFHLADLAVATGRRRRAHYQDVSVPLFEVRFDGNEITWEGFGELEGRRRVNPRSPHEVEHTKTVAEVREILAGPTPKNARKCTPSCSGWDVFETDRGLEVQACDDCNRLRAPALRLSDDDVAQLPEAQKALREAAAAELEENPAGRFTEKGERMYEDIKATYAGDPRAEEIAARTVYARAADGVPGLIVRHGRPPGVPNGRRR